MNYLSTEHLIVYAFLFITLVVGLWVGRNIKSIQEYAIANKMYGTGVLSITMLATYLGGSNVIGAQKHILAYGLIAGLTTIASSLALVLAGTFLVPRMARFSQSITLGDVMKELYGVYGELITGVLGGMFTVCVVGSQMLALGTICQDFLGWDIAWSVGLGGLILVLYASVGGIKSVTITDVIQFVVFIVIIPLIANVAIGEVGGIKALFAKLPTEKLTFGGQPQFTSYFFAALSWRFLPIALSEPPVMQRILMAQNKQQASNMLFTSAAFILVVRMLLILTCLSVFLLVPDIKPSQGAAFTYIINAYFPPVLRGLSIAGLLAIIMSTLDSFLNAGALLFTHNVLKPYFDSQSKAFDELRAVRYTTFLMGCAGIITAFSANEIRTLSYFSISSFSPVIIIPLIAGILGLKTSPKPFIVACVITITTLALVHLLLPSSLGYLVFPIGLAANGISFLAAHVAEHQGIAIAQQEASLSENTIGFKPVPKHILFALFVCLNYMIPFFMYTRQGEATMFAIKLIGGVLCVGLLLAPYWPTWSKKYFQHYWHLTVLYCLPFATTALYLLNGDSSTEWTVNVALSILLLVSLVDWKYFTVISLTGIALGVLFGQLVASNNAWVYENAYTLAYTGLFSTLIGLLFVRSREQNIDEQQQALVNKEETNKASLLQTAKDRVKALQTIQNVAPHNLLQIARDLQSLPVEGEAAKQLHDIGISLVPIAFQLQGIDTKSQDYLRLQIDTVPIESWLTGVLETLQNKRTQPLRYKLLTQHKQLTGDPDQLSSLIAKGTALLQQHAGDNFDSEQEELLIVLEDTVLDYPIPDVAQGYVRQEQALRIVITTQKQLPTLSPSYSPDLTASPVASGTTAQALDEQESKRIVKAHYGYAHTGAHALVYVIPVDVTKVRPKDMDKHYMELGSTLTRADDMFKSGQVHAKEQEEAFLKAVEERSSANLGLIKMAVELIKWYHGPVKRKSGEPFYLHPVAVAHIVLDYNQEEATILGALLHDTVEDTSMLLQYLGTTFGAETANIVDLVTHLQSIPNSIYKIRLTAEENLNMLEKTGTTKGLYVKIADRMHNMRTISGHKRLEKRQHIAQETLDFFVPMAERLGLEEAATEFRQRCAAVLETP